MCRPNELQGCERCSVRGRNRRNRRLLETTNTELNAIAAPAIMGWGGPPRRGAARRRCRRTPRRGALDRRQRLAVQPDRIHRHAHVPRTRVRSLASMATSVPVPMANPRSSCARAAAPLTRLPPSRRFRPAPSRPSPRRPVGRQHFGDHVLGRPAAAHRPAPARRRQSPPRRVLRCSSAPARRSSRSSSSPGAARTVCKLILPVVTVPVLSSTTVSTRRVDSRTSGPLMGMPS